MLEHIIRELHILFPNEIKPYTINSNNDSILITFDDLLGNTLNISLNYIDQRYRYYIFNSKNKPNSISKITILVLLKTLKERPDYKTIMKMVREYK